MTEKFSDSFLFCVVLLILITIFSYFVLTQKQLKLICEDHIIKKIVACNSDYKCRVETNINSHIYIDFPILNETRQICNYKYQE